MKRFVREPLVHFVLLGAVLFGLYSALNRGEAGAPDEIVVTPGRIETLAATYSNVWQRPPTREQLQGLINDYVQEEILTREAIQLGLDREDTVIRGRLRQKMEFLAEDLASAAEPTEQELSDYLANHPEPFREKARFTFRQVYLNPEKHGDLLKADTAALLAELKQADPAGDPAKLGDPLMLPQEFNQETRSAVAAQFGQSFAESLDTLAPGQWRGPVASDHGVHLVFLDHRKDARMPALDEVRSRVKRQFNDKRREEANRQFIENLLKNYQVIIEWPEEESAAPSDAPETARTR